MTILIKNGTVVSATGSYQADVLIDGNRASGGPFGTRAYQAHG